MRAEFLLFDTGESNPHKSLDESNGEEEEEEEWLVCFDHSKQRLQAAAKKAKEEVAVMAFDVDADADGWSYERISIRCGKKFMLP